MSARILVTYATRTGATREVAEAIGEALRDENTTVDVLRSREVTDVSLYSAVVAGTGVRAGRVYRDLASFLRKHRLALSQIPVAYFVVCFTMNEDTEENRRKAQAYLDQIRKRAPEVEPVDQGLFSGAILTEGEDYERTFFLMKRIVDAMAKEEGDHRDWDAIRRWAKGLRPQFL